MRPLVDQRGPFVQAQVSQTTPPSKNIKLCYNTSQHNNSTPTPQQFAVVVETYNAPRPSAYVFTYKGKRIVVPINQFPPNFKPDIGDAFEVTVQISNANGSASCKSKGKYYKGYEHYWFCIRQKSNGGPRFQGNMIQAQGWSKDEAKIRALSILSALLTQKHRRKIIVTEKTHTVTEVAWDGNCL